MNTGFCYTDEMNARQLFRFVKTLAFVEHDEDFGECWIWTGTLRGRGRGYGRFCEGVNKLAHRVSYEHFIGPIPRGMEIDHLCRQTLCVNPRHLEAVAHRKNVQRGLVPGNTHGLGHRHTAEARAAISEQKREWCAANKELMRENGRKRWAERKRLGLGGFHTMPHTEEGRANLKASWTPERRAAQAEYKRLYWARKRGQV